MKAVDTNVLVRFLINDDKRQAAMVHRLFKQAEERKEKLFVPLPVVLEMVWVLESVYEISRHEIIHAVQSMLLMPVLSFEAQSAIQDFVRSAGAGSVGLADLLIAHAARQSGCECVLTFDKKASSFKWFELIAPATEARDD